MKYILLFLLLPVFSSAQKNKNDEVALTDFRQYGYVGGARMDTISSLYAQAEITAGMSMLAGNLIKRFTFDYGQKYKSEKDIRISDASGKVITFSSTAAALNFFDYNGWELVEIFYGVGSGGQGILLKKKK